MTNIFEEGHGIEKHKAKYRNLYWQNQIILENKRDVNN